MGEHRRVTISNAEVLGVSGGITPRELYRAQGFPEGYDIAPEFEGKPLSKTAQVRMCGNSVCPPLAAAMARAQFEHAPVEMAA